MEEVYSLTVEGADVVKKELDAIRIQQERAADLAADVAAAEKAAYAEERARQAQRLASAVSARKAFEEAAHANAMAAQGARGFGDSLGRVAGDVKNVGKDLDKLGLGAGKSFTMAAEGAMSVVAALGTGGLAGVIGAVTIGVGYLAQAWADESEEVAKSKKLTEEALALEEKRWSKATSLASEYLANQKDITIEQRKQNLVAHAAYLVELEKGIQEESDRFARGEVDKNTRLMELRALHEAEFQEGQRLASEYTVELAAHNADKIAKIEIEEAEKTAKEQEKNREEHKRKMEVIDKQFEELRLKREEEERKHRDAIRKAGDEQEIKDNKRKWDMLETITLDGVKADIAAAEKMTREVEDLFNQGALREQERALERAYISDSERIAIMRNIAAIEQAREDAAFDTRMAELDRVDVVTEADQMMVDAQRATAAQLYEERKAQREADTAHHIQQMNLQARATDLATAANFAYGEASMFVAPMVATLSNQVHRLGELNRENAFQIRDFAQELPALIAKEAQAYAAGIAAQALGKASISALDAGRETALGVGMMFSPGGQAAAAGHFKSAALHAAMAAGYGALAGGGAGAALGIGAMRGEGGLVPLTREEQERNAMEDARRARRSGDGRGDGSGISGRAGGSMADAASEAFVVNISYSAGAIAPADERRAAQAVARASRRARNSSFDRRTMGG
jgi:hypothetical protein